MWLLMNEGTFWSNCWFSNTVSLTTLP